MNWINFEILFIIKVFFLKNRLYINFFQYIFFRNFNYLSYKKIYYSPGGKIKILHSRPWGSNIKLFYYENIKLKSNFSLIQ